MGWWPLVVEKLPLFAVAAVVSILVILVQRTTQTVAPIAVLPISLRLENAVVSSGVYLVKTIWPAGLAVFYPYPLNGLPLWQAGVSLAALAGITVAAFWAVRRRPYLAAGWLWYLVTLLPVIGIIQVGAQSHADRYTYVPLTGIFIMVAWGLGDVAGRWRAARAGLVVGAVCALAGLTACAYVQTGYWRSSVTLFTHASEVTRDNYIAEKNLGVALADEQKYAEAVPHYMEALRILPNDAGLYYNFGNALAAQGNLEEAIGQYYRALEIDPDNVATYYSFGNVLASLKRFEEAVACYDDAIKRTPEHVGAHVNKGNSLAALGKPEIAEAEYRTAIEFDPNNENAHVNLANVLTQLKRYDEAVDEYMKAISIEPNRLETWESIAYALMKAGQPREAALAYTRILLRDPENKKAQEALLAIKAHIYGP